MVEVETGEVRVLFEARNGAHCGVATFHPRVEQVVFILGPENPTPEWRYNAWHRHGVLVDVASPRQFQVLDARDLTPPFTPGALRGGSHVHVWHPAGDWVSFTYEDHLLASLPAGSASDRNQRNVGVSVSGRPVRVSLDHPRNHHGSAFSVLVTRTAAEPRAGSDEISRAFEEAWVGTRGYRRAEGGWQERALAFQGLVTRRGPDVGTHAEVFIVDLPNDLTVAGDEPLAGTPTRRPAPPRGVLQRRLTFTGDRKFPGLQGPRHWLRSSPDGEAIAYLAKDDAGVVQLWTVSPRGGAARQLTRNAQDIASSFTWSPDGRWIAHALDGSVCVTDAMTGQTRRCAEAGPEGGSVRPEACVFSPDGKRIAYVRRTQDGAVEANQIWVVEGVE
jgi:WD40 repeat protein